jgi:dihydroflavonol-4-reductase
MVTERGLPAVIVNHSTPIGPRDARPTPTGRVIAEAAKGRISVFVDTGLNLAM